MSAERIDPNVYIDRASERITCHTMKAKLLRLEASIYSTPGYGEFESESEMRKHGIEVYKTYLTYVPNDTKAMNELARTYLGFLMYNEARVANNRALEIDPSDLDSYKMRNEINDKESQFRRTVQQDLPTKPHPPVEEQYQRERRERHEQYLREQSEEMDRQSRPEGWLVKNAVALLCTGLSIAFFVCTWLPLNNYAAILFLIFAVILFLAPK